MRPASRLGHLRGRPMSDQLLRLEARVSVALSNEVRGFLTAIDEIGFHLGGSFFNGRQEFPMDSDIIRAH